MRGVYRGVARQTQCAAILFVGYYVIALPIGVPLMFHTELRLKGKVTLDKLPAHKSDVDRSNLSSKVAISTYTNNTDTCLTEYLDLRHNNTGVEKQWLY